MQYGATEKEMATADYETTQAAERQGEAGDHPKHSLANALQQSDSAVTYQMAKQSCDLMDIETEDRSSDADISTYQ